MRAAVTSPRACELARRRVRGRIRRAFKESRAGAQKRKGPGSFELRAFYVKSGSVLLFHTATVSVPSAGGA
jgi:hypothetical protein